VASLFGAAAVPSTICPSASSGAPSSGEQVDEVVRDPARELPDGAQPLDGVERLFGGGVRRCRPPLAHGFHGPLCSGFVSRAEDGGGTSGESSPELHARIAGAEALAESLRVADSSLEHLRAPLGIVARRTAGRSSTRRPSASSCAAAAAC
jgi:hypothetical protein